MYGPFHFHDIDDLLELLDFYIFSECIFFDLFDGGVGFILDEVHQVISLILIDLSLLLFLEGIDNPDVEVFVFGSSYFFYEIVFTELVGYFVDER